MIRFEHVSFHYGEAAHAAGVTDIDVRIGRGACVVLCGESGCGKTTLTRLVNGLIPHYYEGTLEGRVLVDGQDVSAQPLYETAPLVASVFQNPRSQFFNVDTTSEVIFGCENLGWPEAQIQARLTETVRDFQLEPLMDRNIFKLSGGEKQRIACAGAAMMATPVIVLDEPSANLDAGATEALRRVLARWKAQGKTILISEHRLYYLQGIADRFIYLEQGRITHDWSAAAFAALSAQERESLGLRAYDLSELRPSVLPEDGDEKLVLAPQGAFSGSFAAIDLEDFHFAYKHEPPLLAIDRAELPVGRIVGIIGNNGAGKSTFARCFCGLEKGCGLIRWRGETLRTKERLRRTYLVMQETGHQLFTESVLEEVLVSMAEPDTAQAEAILAQLDLLALAQRHPLSLSGGQQQRVAVASAIAAGRSLLFFDEPTSGLDRRHMLEVAAVLRDLCARGMSCYVITHDLELICACCSEIMRIERGRIAEQYRLDAQGLARVRTAFFGEG